MNKQEAIERIEKKKSTLNGWEELTRNRAFNEALDIVRKIDETEKQIVPQFVAEWIGYKKAEGYTIYGTLMEAEANPMIKKWLSKSRQEALALAWIFGYDVEKEEETDGTE